MGGVVLVRSNCVVCAMSGAGSMSSNKMGLIKVVRSGSFHMIGWRNGGLAFGVRGGE